MKQIFIDLNWTGANLVLMALGMFIVFVFGVLGRQSNPKVKRTKFNLREWFVQTTNWLGAVLSIACSLTLIAFPVSIVGSIPGLEVTNPEDFAPVWAFLVGAFGTPIIKLLLKSVMGATGAYNAHAAPPQS